MVHEEAVLESPVKWSATIAVFGTLCPLLMIEFGTLPAVDPTLYAHTDEALEEHCMAEVKQVLYIDCSKKLGQSAG